MAEWTSEVEFVRDGESVSAHDTKTGVTASGKRKSEALRNLAEALQQQEGSEE